MFTFTIVPAETVPLSLEKTYSHSIDEAYSLCKFFENKNKPFSFITLNAVRYCTDQSFFSSGTYLSLSVSITLEAKIKDEYSAKQEGNSQIFA